MCKPASTRRSIAPALRALARLCHPQSTLANLFASQRTATSPRARVTEGFATAFQTQSGSDDTGTRFIVRYSGFPSNATVYIPDFVAGSDAAIPTAGGDLGGTQSGGEYVPGSGTLRLAPVQYADSTRAGGYVTPSAGRRRSLRWRQPGAAHQRRGHRRISSSVREPQPGGRRAVSSHVHALFRP